MSLHIPHKQVIGRRAELMAELLLQELEPSAIRRAPPDTAGYDFLLEFGNQRGGLNLIAVEVKAYENLARPQISLPTARWESWRQSNIPVLLVVIDPKATQALYALPTEQSPTGPEQTTVRLSVLDESAKSELRRRFVA